MNEFANGIRKAHTDLKKQIEELRQTDIDNETYNIGYNEAIDDILFLLDRSNNE